MPHPSTKTILARFEEAKTRRMNFAEHWQSVANLVLPTRQFSVLLTPGQPLRNKIFNETAPLALESFASAMHGLLVNPSIRWFGLRMAEEPLNELEEVHDWLYDSTTRMLDWFSSTESGFSTNIHEVFLDLGAFGTAVLLLRNTPSGVTHQARQLSNWFMVENDRGEITDTYRQYEMSARDVNDTFGEKSIPEFIHRLAHADQRLEKKVCILHYVYLRRPEERLNGRIDGANKEWGSIYMTLDPSEVLRVGGFDENPHVTPRWSKAPEEVYGRGPGMVMLPAIRVANVISKTNLIAAELAVFPPMYVPSGAIEGPVRTAPGSLVYGRPGRQEQPAPLQTGVSPERGEVFLEKIERRIEEAFFVDKLKLPDNDRMTAEEVRARRQEALLQASPALSRMYSELLTPTIQRNFRSMAGRGLFRPPPDVISGRKLVVDYRSPLALSQKASQNNAILQTLAEARTFIEIDPTVIDANIDRDKALRTMWSNNNADPKLLKRRQETLQFRQAQQEAQQAAQQAEIAATAAGAAKDAASGLKDIGGGV